MSRSGRRRRYSAREHEAHERRRGHYGGGRYPFVCVALSSARRGAGGCYFCGGAGIGPHPDCPAGNAIDKPSRPAPAR